MSPQLIKVLVLALFWSITNSKKKSDKLLDVSQLVANFICCLLQRVRKEKATETTSDVA